MLLYPGDPQKLSDYGHSLVIFSCDRAALCPSVCLSVTPFWLCSHHLIITKLGDITNDKSDVHAKVLGQRSKVKVTEVTTQLNRFRPVTNIWIHIWWWKHVYGLMILRGGALLLFNVITQISRSHGSKKRRIWPRLCVSGLLLQFEFTNGYEMIHKAWSSIEEVRYCFSRSSVKFQGHTALKASNLTQIGRFRTVTPVWIHQWLRNDAQSLK